MTTLRRIAARGLWLVRPRLPLAAGRRRAAASTARAVADPAAFADARAQMAHLAVPDERLDQAAAGYLGFWAETAELRWRTREVTRLSVEGVEHLVAAHRQGRGVLVSFTHHGRYDGMFGSLSHASGVPVGVLTSAKDIAEGGPNMLQHLRLVGSGGGLVPSSVGLAGVVERLRQGEALAVATDVPGGSVVTLGGRRVRCSSGAVRGAVEAGAPIVPVTSRHTGSTAADVTLAVHPAIEPDGDVQDLLERVVAVHEASVLAWPEASFVPLQAWSPADPA